MKRNSARAHKLFMLAPYAAVLTGMYIVKNIFFTILLYNGLILIPVIHKFKKEKPGVLQFMNPLISMVLPLSFLAAGPILYFIWPWINLSQIEIGIVLSNFKLPARLYVPFFIHFALIHPIIEELFWRFTLKGEPRETHLQSLLFAGYHVLVLRFFLNWPFLIAIFLFLYGVSQYWHFMKQKGEHLHVVLSHVTADFGILFVVLFLLA